jgi:hypothetical protein
MCEKRHVIACFVRIILVAGAAQVAGAEEKIMLRAGDVGGANTVFAIEEGAKPQQIVVRTTQSGVAGSRIEVTIDTAKKPAFSHIFTTQECKFGDSGSKCEVVIPASNPAYASLLAQFKRGRDGHVTVADAGVMKIDQTVSLLGFSKTLRGSRHRISDRRSGG